MKQTVVFDFDGVIHSYISGWLGEDVIPDKPVEGIKEAIEEIRASNYEVVVVSTRCASEKGLNAVINWLEKYNITVDRVLKEKPPATVYIDDRAICFDGQANKLLSKIKEFETWQEKREYKIKSLENIIVGLYKEFNNIEETKKAIYLFIKNDIKNLATEFYGTENYVEKIIKIYKGVKEILKMYEEKEEQENE